MRERPLIKEPEKRVAFPDSGEKESSMSSSSEEIRRRMHKKNDNRMGNHARRHQGLNTNRQGLSRSKDSEVLQEEEGNVDQVGMEEKGDGEVREELDDKVDPVEGEVARPKEMVENDEKRKLKEDLSKHRKEQEEVRKRQQKAIEEQKKTLEKRHKKTSSHETRQKQARKSHQPHIDEYDKSSERHVEDDEEKGTGAKGNLGRGGQDYADQYDDEGSEGEEESGTTQNGGHNKMMRHRRPRTRNRGRKSGLQEFNKAKTDDNEANEGRRRVDHYNKNRRLSRESDE